MPSPILSNVHLDLIVTMITDTYQSRPPQYLWGFARCASPNHCRYFVRGKGGFCVRRREITVTYPRTAHNPTPRAAAWDRNPHEPPWLDGTKLTLRCQ